MSNNSFFICPECGAQLKKYTAVCPYCGSHFEEGEEILFMNKLEDIRQDMSNLAPEAKKQVKSAVSGYGKTALKAVIFIIILIVVAIGALFLYRTQKEKKESERILKEVNFRAEHFDKLDKMFEAGDYEGLAEYISAIWEQPGSEVILDWDHYNLITVYNDQKTISYARESLKSPEPDQMLIENAVFYALYMTTPGYKELYTRIVSSEDMAQISAWIEDADRYLTEDLAFTSEEIQYLSESCMKEGYLSFKKYMNILPEVQVLIERNTKK